MIKPRIVIADTDDNFAIPLQIKFIKKYFEYIDLEVITDAQYFGELFSVPQRIDILIVSELIYDETLNKHNITKLFVMCESNEVLEEKQNKVNYLYKYSDINQNFEAIIGNSALVFNQITRKKDEPKVILCYSANGGAGKTTVAVGLSANLARNYKNVLYIKADRLQAQSSFFDSQIVVSDLSICSNLQRQPAEAYQTLMAVIKKDLFSYLPTFKTSLLSLGLSYSIYEQIISGAKASYNYDYIIVDSDVVFDDYKAKLISLADKVVLVTEQSKNSILATHALLNNIDDVDDDKYVIVCNKYQNSRQDDSPIEPTYTVAVNIENVTDYEKMNCNDLAQINGIRKVAHLL